MGRTAVLARRPAGKSKTPASKAKATSASRNGKAIANARGHRPFAPANDRRAKEGIHTYRAALDYLNGLPNYEKKLPSPRQRFPFTLTRIKRILADLGNPHKEFRSVHIAGTKGKGSTAAMLANMLTGSGMKVGLYTSPHIVDVRERIAINGRLIPEATFGRLVGKIAHVVEKAKMEPPTFFEILTAVAFEYFKDQKVEIAVVETGLGGRLDATNVLKPEVCGLTSISYDHMALLGNTLEDIAVEKAGIFKEHIPVVSAPQPKNVKLVLRKAAEKIKTPILFVGEDIEFSYRFESSRSTGPQARIGVTTPTSHFDHLPVPLVGEHQAINCGVALSMLDQLKGKGFTIDDEAAIAGLSKVSLVGRMEMLCTEPRVLADGAHNAASVEALMRAIGQNITYDSMVVIFGCCADKDVDGMLRLILLGADKIIFTNIQSPRSALASELAARLAGVSGRMAQVAPTLADAMVIAEKAVAQDDLICITGSFFLVREAKALFEGHPHRVKSTSNPV